VTSRVSACCCVGFPSGPEDFMHLHPRLFVATGVRGA
jgi:hypothetical protein